MGKRRKIPDPSIIVLGIGNLLRRDDGIGVRVIEALRERYALPPSVALVDGGTAGFGLLSLIEGADNLIVVDAVQAGDKPGSVFVFAPDEVPAPETPQLSLHEIGLLEVLTVLEAASGKRPKTVIIGVEPQDISPWEPQLTSTVQATVLKVMELVLDELGRLGVKITSAVGCE
jgi:hydrogenase maturation protease